MKRVILLLAGVMLLAGCSRETSTGLGASPNNDTGMAQQNTVLNASPDRQIGPESGVTNSSGSTNPQGAELNRSDMRDTNSSAKPQLPPSR